MMASFLIIIFLLLMFTGCNSSKNGDIDSRLYNKWILVNVSGGIDGRTNEINTEQEKHILEFSEDNSINYYFNDSLISNNRFQIEERETIYSSDKIDFIIYENQLAPEAITYLSKDTLAISDNFYDGFTKVYIKFSQ